MLNTVRSSDGWKISGRSSNTDIAESFVSVSNTDSTKTQLCPGRSVLVVAL